MKIRWAAVLAWMLVSAACSSTGSEGAQSFDFDYPDMDPAPVVLDMQTGTLNLRSVSGNSVHAAITTNVGAWRASQTVDSDGTAHITQGTARNEMIPNANNQWDVEMGTGQPVALVVNSLAASSDLKLGGLPLRSLAINGTSGDHVLTYASANPLEDGGDLQINVTSGDITINGVFKSHVNTLQSVTTAGNQTFEFGDGDLVQDLRVDIETRIGDTLLRIPMGTAVRVMFTAASGRVMELSPNYVEVSDGVFETEEYANGDRPHVEISVRSVAGDLRIAAVPKT